MEAYEFEMIERLVIAVEKLVDSPKLIELTGVAFQGTDDEYHYTFFVNPDRIESIHPKKDFTQVFMAGDSDSPYHVCESWQKIMVMMG